MAQKQCKLWPAGARVAAGNRGGLWHGFGRILHIHFCDQQEPTTHITPQTRTLLPNQHQVTKSKKRFTLPMLHIADLSVQLLLAEGLCSELQEKHTKDS